MHLSACHLTCIHLITCVLFLQGNTRSINIQANVGKRQPSCTWSWTTSTTRWHSTHMNWSHTETTNKVFSNWAQVRMYIVDWNEDVLLNTHVSKSHGSQVIFGARVKFVLFYHFSSSWPCIIYPWWPMTRRWSCTPDIHSASSRALPTLHASS